MPCKAISSLMVIIYFTIKKEISINEKSSNCFFTVRVLD